MSWTYNILDSWRELNAQAAKNPSLTQAILPPPASLLPPSTFLHLSFSSSSSSSSSFSCSFIPPSFLFFCDLP